MALLGIGAYNPNSYNTDFSGISEAGKYLSKGIAGIPKAKELDATRETRLDAENKANILKSQKAEAEGRILPSKEDATIKVNTLSGMNAGAGIEDFDADQALNDKARELKNQKVDNKILEAGQGFQSPAEAIHAVHEFKNSILDYFTTKDMPLANATLLAERFEDKYEARARAMTPTQANQLRKDMADEFAEKLGLTEKEKAELGLINAKIKTEASKQNRNYNGGGSTKPETNVGGLLNATTKSEAYQAKVTALQKKIDKLKEDNASLLRRMGSGDVLGNSQKTPDFANSNISKFKAYTEELKRLNEELKAVKSGKDEVANAGALYKEVYNKEHPNSQTKENAPTAPTEKTITINGEAVTKSQVIAKLKAAGNSEEDINAFLKSKGF